MNERTTFNISYSPEIKLNVYQKFNKHIEQIKSLDTMLHIRIKYIDKLKVQKSHYILVHSSGNIYVTISFFSKNYRLYCLRK